MQRTRYIAGMDAIKRFIDQQTKHPMSRYFDPAVVIEYFERFAAFRSELKKLYPGIFSDLPDRELPKSSGTTDHEGRGYINRRALEQLREDCDYILDLLKEVPDANISGNQLSASQTHGVSDLVNIFRRFHVVALQLCQRHGNRTSIVIHDEYDVQDLMHALMRLYFDDVRVEEHTPSYAGGASRMDFHLKETRIAIETKMTRHGMTSKQLGDELILDIKRYSGHPDCDVLYCLVYDPQELLKNPRGLEADLSRKHEKLDVKVFIVPNR
jgi:hypothetical protein